MQTEPFVYSGFQTGVVYELNQYGRPKGTGLTAYAGLEVYAAKVYTLTLPEPRKVPHIGNDRLLKVQQFPSQEVASGDISVGAEDLDLIALLGGSTIVEKAGMKMLPHMTDLQGDEPLVGMILYQAALAQSGGKRFHFHMITETQAITRLAGFGENPEDNHYSIAPNPVERYLWGQNMAELADIYDPLSGVSESGAFEAGVWSGFSEYEPRIIAFIANGSEDEFLFPLSMPPKDLTKVVVYTALGDGGAEEVDPADYTLSLTKVDFDVAPANGTEVIVLYQKA